MEVAAQIKPLREITYERFKDFLDSLNEERKTWSLDLQHHFKDDKEFYDGMKNRTLICVCDEGMIGLCSYYEHDKNPEMIEVSFVVKKKYQSKGIGTTLLNVAELFVIDLGYKYITAKHYKDNIASHKAFLKVGYEEWKEDWMEDNNLTWKIKEVE